MFRVSDSGGWGVGGELFKYPYPLKVQARPQRNQRPALRSRVPGGSISLNDKTTLLMSERK